jgi:hypothetical protein
MKPLVFYFSFQFGDDVDDRTYSGKGFICTKEGTAKFLKYFDSEEDETLFMGSDKFLESWSDIESEYGVHDWVTSPDDRVIGIGFDSYEVERNRLGFLMNDWRNYFISIMGEENVSMFVDVDLQTDFKNDWDIYEDIRTQLGE